MAAFPATGGHAPPRRRPGSRKGGWTLDRRNLFLSMLGTCLNVRRAVDAVGLTPSAAYQLKRRDPAFADAWVEALDEGYSNLEMEMLRQAIEGCETTETVLDGDTGTVRHVKITHSYPHATALRLMQAHCEEVRTYRRAEGRRRSDPDADARLRAHMDLVRARILGLPEPGGGDAQDAEMPESGTDHGG
jgi:hypothetical protein